MPWRLLPRPRRLTETERSPEKYFPFSRKTLNLQSEKSNEQEPHLKGFQSQNQNMTSRERQSTLMSSSVISTTFPLLKRMWDASEEWRSLLEKQMQLKKSKQVAIGSLLGMQPSKQPCLFSPTELRNYDSGVTTWHPNSLPSMQTATTNSSPLTKQSEPWSEEVSQSCSLIGTSSLSCIQHTFYLMVSKELEVGALQVVINEGQKSNQQTPAGGSTVQEDVATHQPPAAINTFATSASSTAMGKKVALSKTDTVYRMHPKYLRYNLWDSEEKHNTPTPFIPLDLGLLAMG